jgi:hypothetical protein
MEVLCFRRLEGWNPEPVAVGDGAAEEVVEVKEDERGLKAGVEEGTGEAAGEDCEAKETTSTGLGVEAVVAGTLKRSMLSSETASILASTLASTLASILCIIPPAAAAVVNTVGGS